MIIFSFLRNGKSAYQSGGKYPYHTNGKCPYRTSGKSTWHLHLASVTVVDIYKRVFKKKASDRHYLIASKLATVFWGIYAISFALFANRLGSLIEAVNILGSLFYGTILGIFIIAFCCKSIGGNATFIAALIAELTVLGCYFFTKIPYLWFLVIGCVVLIVLAHLMNPLFAVLNKNKA